MKQHGPALGCAANALSIATRIVQPRRGSLLQVRRNYKRDALRGQLLASIIRPDRFPSDAPRPRPVRSATPLPDARSGAGDDGCHGLLRSAASIHRPDRTGHEGGLI